MPKPSGPQRKYYPCGPGLISGPSSALAPAGAFADVRGFYSWRDGLYELARPWVQEAAASDNTYGNLTALFQWKSRLFVSDLNSALWRENGTFSGVFAAESGIGANASFQWIYWPPLIDNQNGCLLIGTNSSAGWFKLESVTATSMPAGIPRALDPVLTLAAAGTLLANGQSRAYRVVFGRKDASTGKNVVLGAPSGRMVATATAAQNVTVKCWLPKQITSLTPPYYVQVYASAIIAGNTDDNLQLIYQKDLTAADVGAGFITITDTTPDGWRSTALYTNPAEEGIARANQPPPIAYDSCSWKGCAWAINTRQRYRQTVQMLANPPIYTISAVGVGTGVYTFSGTPDLTGIVAGMTLSVIGDAAANNGTFSITSVNTGAFTITTNNAASVAHAGAGTAVAARLSIGSFNYDASLSAEDVANKRYLVSTSGTAQQNVANTAASLIRVVNLAATGDVYAYYASGPDDAAGLIYLEGRDFASWTGTIATGAVWAGTWNPVLLTTQVPVNDAVPGRVAYSKYLQPEHWAGADYIDVGIPTSSGYRLIPLRDSLIVWKQDGIFRITGNAASGFVPTRIAPGTLPPSTGAQQYMQICSWGDRAYGITSRGLLEITDTNSRIISGPTDDVVGQDDFNAQACGIAYNGVDDTVHLFVAPSLTRSYVYSVQSGTWTQDTSPYGYFLLPAITYDSSAGSYAGMLASISSSSGKHVYVLSVPTQGQTQSALAASVRPYRTESDYQHLVNQTAFDGATHTITATALGTASIAVGSYFLDDNGYPWVVTLAAGPVYTLAVYNHTHVFAFANGRRMMLVPQNAYIEWHPITLGDEGVMKVFTEVEVILDKASLPLAGGTHSITVYNETDATGATQTFTPATLSGTPTNVRMVLPPTLQTCRRLHVRYSHNSPDEYPVVKGLAVTVEAVADGNELT
jgi:hypothetical protein